MPIWLLVAALFGLSGVALDAFGTHALAAATAEDQAAFATAARYQLLHALALAAIAWLVERDVGSRAAWMAGFAFSAGIVLFSGSIYLRVLVGVGSVGVAAPIGGVCLMAGWALVALYAVIHLRNAGHK